MNERTTLEKIAPTVEEAVAEGLAELNLPAEAVDVEVLDTGSRGLFGVGGRQARVRLTTMGTQPPGPEAGAPAPVPEPLPVPVPATEPAPEPSFEEDELLNLSEKTVSELLAKMKIEAKLSISYGEPDEEGRRPVCVELHGDDLGILVGRRAEILNALLKEAGFAARSLETWLRDGFFAQHCDLFHQRPFLWQIWDGLRDGFSALVNYHKLDRKNLETLIYTYLGDWTRRQKDDIASGVDGAQERLAAAEILGKRLELILEGEAPYDIFVRWKPIGKQPIGWEPDLNDGVRLNIRPFLSVPDVRTRGAGVLRGKPNIKWDKDRGKEPKRPIREYPWFWGWDGTVDFVGGSEFSGDRFNDCHYTLAARRRARDDASKNMANSTVLAR